MPQDEQLSQRNENAADRLWRSRWLLAVASASAAALAYVEPDRLGVIIAVACAFWLVAAFLPRPSGLTINLADRNPRRAVWPDSSLKALTEALYFPAYILDSAGSLRYANAAAEPAFGTPVVGDPVSVTFRRPDVARMIASAVASNTSLSIEYDDHVPRDRWFNLRVDPVPRPGGGQPEFFLLSFLDLTETRRAEQMRSDFIANASHELRTPLASLRGFIETIKGPAAEDPKAQARFLDIMLDQSERMSRLIDDLLSLSRIEMKAHVRPQGEVSLHDVIGNVANALQPLGQKLGVKIEKKLPDATMIVRGERDELIQVFENLVENACKYGASGGKVEISASIVPAAKAGTPARAEITVRDWGPGIPEEHLSRLTERFYRVDISSSRDKQGTGLGLAIVKHILNRHGSRLIVNSKVGQGATFSVSLPLAEETATVST